MAGRRILLVLLAFLAGALVGLVTTELGASDAVTVIVFMVVIGIVFWIGEVSAGRRGR